MSKQRFTLKEVQAHNTKDSAWIIVRNDVYDITKYITQHPGGEKVLLMAAGQDVTYLMETSHPFTRAPWKLLESYKIGEIEHGFVDYSNENPFWIEVKKRVKKYFDDTKLDPKDPIPTFQTFIIILTMFLIGYYFSASRGMLWGAGLLGVARALFGINTMHAASHFAISHKPWVWYWVDWFCFDILMGGSSLAWNYQHVVGHHQHTNVFAADPDLPIVQNGDMRRVFPNQRWKWIYQYQAFYLPLLYPLLAFKTRYYDILLILGYNLNGNLVMNVTMLDRVLQVITKIIFVGIQFLIPRYYFGLEWSTVLINYVVADLASGAWLAYFFQVNHISDEIYYTDKDHSKAKEWASLQVEGTIDYAHDSKLFTFLSGTLNYQAVHHLFPSIAPHHYVKIAPIVQQCCKEFNVKYQVLPTFGKALAHHFKELHRMGYDLATTHNAMLKLD